MNVRKRTFFEICWETLIIHFILFTRIVLISVFTVEKNFSCVHFWHLYALRTNDCNTAILSAWLKNDECKFAAMRASLVWQIFYEQLWFDLFGSKFLQLQLFPESALRILLVTWHPSSACSKTQNRETLPEWMSFTFHKYHPNSFLLKFEFRKFSSLPQFSIFFTETVNSIAGKLFSFETSYFDALVVRSG